MAIAAVVSAMQQLTSSDPDPLAPCGWIERIKYNVQRTRQLQLHSNRTIIEQYGLEMPADSTEHAQWDMWEFVVEGLTLLLNLNKACIVPNNTPVELEKDYLLSVNEQQIVRRLAEFLSLLCLYPYLDHGVGLPIILTSSLKVNVIKSDLSDSVRETHLYKSLYVLLQCIRNELLTPILLPNLLSNILAGLLQIVYKPTTKSSSERDWCQEQLHYLMHTLSCALVVRELLTLQGIASQRRGKERGNLLWLRQACGKLLSKMLMERNGVQLVLRGIFESSTGSNSLREESVSECSENWQKCQSVAQILSSCPLQADSIEQYYLLVLPQVLGLIRLPPDGVGRQFLRVAISTLSLMLSKQNHLTMEYLIKPLLQPLIELTANIKFFTSAALKTCLSDLTRILSVLEPSSPLMSVLLTYLPILFNVWRVTRHDQLSIMSLIGSQAKGIILSVLKPLDTAAQLEFFKHILYQETNISFKCLSSHLMLSVSTEGELVIELNKTPLTFTSKLMIDIGESIIELLQGELKSFSTSLFTHCLEYMSNVLARECNLEERGTLNVSSNDGDTLLQWEQDLISSVTEKVTFSNAMILYITASLCESMDGDSPKNLDLLSTLKSLVLIIRSHSRCCLNERKIMTNKVEEALLGNLTGGHVTLSIAFGLLSVILASKQQQVNRLLQPILTSLLPYLETISHYYPDGELSTLAEDLRICIATLGSVWSTKMTEKVHDKQRESTHISKPLIEEVSSPPPPPPPPPPLESTIKLSLYQQALRDLKDPLLPAQGHGLRELGRLVRRRDKETLTQIRELFRIFSSHIDHSDSYIYLAAINGLVDLASVQPDMTIPHLCCEYAQFEREKQTEGAPTREGGEGAPTREGREGAPTREGGEGAPTREGARTSRSLECRIKLGEALVKAAHECGELLPHFSRPLISAVMFNIKDSDPLIRASALSNLAEMCSILKWSITPIENEVVNCLGQVLKYESDAVVKRAALAVIKQLFRGLDTEVLCGESLLKLYRLLKDVECTDSDSLTQTHTRAVLGELDVIMKQLLFPAQTLSKKISVLDHMI